MACTFGSVGSSRLTERSRINGNLCAFAGSLPEDRRFSLASDETLAEIAEITFVRSPVEMRTRALLNGSP
jgi:hypothetical protein